MSDIVEKVKAAILSADNGWDEDRADIPHGDSLARAAIKATLDHLQFEVGRMTIEVTNETENLLADVRRILDACFKEDVKDIMNGFLATMLSQAIKEMEG
jgi:ethanolamine utilization cobalamin adenosyltransferase